MKTTTTLHSSFLILHSNNVPDTLNKWDYVAECFYFWETTFRKNLRVSVPPSSSCLSAAGIGSVQAPQTQEAFKCRRHKKSSSYKNFATFAHFAWDLIQVLYSSFIIHHFSLFLSRLAFARQLPGLVPNFFLNRWFSTTAEENPHIFAIPPMG